MKLAREAAEWAGQILILIFATTAVAMPCVIPSGSMEGTLMTGDHVIVDKLAYSPHGRMSGKALPYEDVHRGDIIVFRYPVDIRQNYVKRVIGVPGDHIRLEGGAVIRNGVKLKEDYIQHLPLPFSFYRDYFPLHPPEVGLAAQAQEMLRDHVRGDELIVPEGQYFALGDNRDNSEDSRYWGLVPRENIIGKPVLIFWSYDAPTEDLLDFSMSHNLDVAMHFFSKTRWDRTFKLIRP